MILSESCKNRLMSSNFKRDNVAETTGTAMSSSLLQYMRCRGMRCKISSHRNQSLTGVHSVITPLESVHPQPIQETNETYQTDLRRLTLDAYIEYITANNYFQDVPCLPFWLLWWQDKHILIFIHTPFKTTNNGSGIRSKPDTV